MKALDKAIKFCEDASFNFNNFNKHINGTAHLKEMNLTPEQYYKKAESLTLSKGPDILEFKRKDGLTVKFNYKTKEYVVYNEKRDEVATFHERRYSQVESELKREGIKIPEKLNNLIQIQNQKVK